MALTPPLCIIQARLHSSRMEQKMLRTLGGYSLIERAWRDAWHIFGVDHVVVAIPASDEDGPLGNELRRYNANVFAWDGAESDVLGRFHACAHRYRWRPESILHRWTADDPFKLVGGVRRVLDGERLPAEIGGEAFTLAMLDAAHERETHPHRREHITYAIYGSLPPSPPAGRVWTIDSDADLEAARTLIAQRVAA
jgi:spore coat polysaccharide biosynthesis protein SpsF (cytidylyltransferase family)